MKENDAVITVKNVSKNFVLPHDKVNTIKGMFTSLTRGRSWKVKETQHALRNISFEVKKGEFFGIVGRNGSGKSTLLKILAGIYQPTKGSVITSGKLVPFIELGVGFNPELTGRENVYLNGAMMGFHRKKIDGMYDEIVSFSELERFMDQKLKNYSTGMQVRLAFSVAIKAEADILLFDEVLAVGDAAFQRKCFDYFRELKARNTTVVLVTHDMSAVRQYCDRAILIENGVIMPGGSASEVASDYSKMFVNDEVSSSEDSNSKKQNGSQKRWGDEVIRYSKFEIPKRLKQDDALTIKVWAEARNDVDSPIFGFSIKNASRTVLMGTNTMEKHKVVGMVKAGERIVLEWKVPNIFCNGMHYLDLAIVYKGGSSIADWWESAAGFNVLKEEATHYIVSPSVEVEVIQ